MTSPGPVRRQDIWLVAVAHRGSPSHRSPSPRAPPSPSRGSAKALAPIWLVFWFMVVCYVIGGAGHGVKNVAFRSLIHERVPADRHGRAFAAYNGLRTRPSWSRSPRAVRS